MDVVDFKKEHFDQMSLQEGQAYLSGWMTPDMAQALEESSWAFTGIDNGRVLGCAGVAPVWQGRGMAWAYLSCNINPTNMMKVHRAVQRYLKTCYLQRIEATVDEGFEPGHRWMRLLGFKLEAQTMQAYRPDGGNCSLYARVL